MFYLQHGDIIPAKGVGILKLGMSFEQITELMEDYQVEDLGEAWLVGGGDVQIWINKKKNAAYQIMVFGGFQGKFADTIGIGSTLGDVKEHLNLEWHDELDATVLDTVPGICFQPDDSGEDSEGAVEEDYATYELKEPIGYISVFRDLPHQAD